MATTATTPDTTPNATEPKTYLNYIGGEWRPTASGETFDDTNPARTSEVVARFQRSTVADVDAAIAAAEAALPAWRALPAPERGEIILKAALLLEARRDALARDMTREMGKPLRETHWRRADGHRLRQVRRRGGTARGGRDGSLGAARQDVPDDPPAARRRRHHHAVELPDGDSGVEDLPRAAGRQHRRSETGQRHAALRSASGRDSDGGGRPGGRAELRHRPRRRAGRRAGERSAHRHDLADRLDRGRQARGGDLRTRPAPVQPGAWAARTRSSCWTTPTWTRR